MNPLEKYLGALQVVLCMSVIGLAIQLTLEGIYILFQWVKEKVR
jgi:hypothetical protein